MNNYSERKFRKQGQGKITKKSSNYKNCVVQQIRKHGKQSRKSTSKHSKTSKQTDKQTMNRIGCEQLRNTSYENM